MSTTKIIVAGGRDFKDYQSLESILSLFILHLANPVEIVSGEAKGADKLGERFAIEHNVRLTQFPAN